MPHVSRLLPLLVLLTAHPALGARPVPDRPFEALSGFLVSKGTLETELGFLLDEGTRFPMRLKYGIGSSFEPRISADVAGIDEGRPGLNLEGKFRIHRSGTTGIAGYLASSLPFGGEAWTGTARVLVTGRLDRVLLGANTGLNLSDGDGSMGIDGVPMTLLLGTRLASTVSAHAEVSVVVRGAIEDLLVDGGLRWMPTEIVAVDAVVGWRLPDHQPFVGCGMTVNLGAPGS
jgi:hypothetical protein